MGSRANAAESDLDAAVRAYDEATVRNDVATLAKLVSDDYMLVNSDSSLQDKQSYLEDFKVPGFKLDPYVLEQPARTNWGNTALVGGRGESELDAGWSASCSPAAHRARLDEAAGPLATGVHAVDASAGELVPIFSDLHAVCD